MKNAVGFYFLFYICFFCLFFNKKHYIIVNTLDAVVFDCS